MDPRWQPLEARSAAEIVAQHPDPLDALSKGVFPAIILRGQMQKIEVATALQRLNEGRAERTPSLPWHEGRACNYGTLGVDMQSALRWQQAKKPHGPGVFAEVSENLTRAFLRAGLERPIAALHNAVRGLAGRRTVDTARDLASNASFPPGIFRSHGAGNFFPQHFDSLHSYEWNQRSCGTGGHLEKNLTAKQIRHFSQESHYGRDAVKRYADAFRFREQFSALLVLQRAKLPCADVIVYDSHWTDLKDDCGVSGTSHGVGVNLFGFAKSRTGIQRVRHTYRSRRATFTSSTATVSIR